MPLDTQLSDLAHALGADFYGVADLVPAREAILAQGGPVVARYPRSITLGIALMDAIVDQLPARDDKAAAQLYRHHGYDVVNRRLDDIVSRLSTVLRQAGHDVLPIPASQIIDTERLIGLFSHKLGGHLAGLGWIGKNCLLVTLEVGPRVRWATILTDAPLAPTGEPMEERCGDCRACVDICPVQAFTGVPFRESDPRSARYDVHKCRAFQARRSEQMGVSVSCGLCLYACPYGRS
jgi:epoxyqueuosine reductase